MDIGIRHSILRNVAVTVMPVADKEDKKIMKKKEGKERRKTERKRDGYTNFPMETPCRK